MIKFDSKYSDLSRYTTYKAACILWHLEKAHESANAYNFNQAETIEQLNEAITLLRNMQDGIITKNETIDQEINDELQKNYLYEKVNGF